MVDGTLDRSLKEASLESSRLASVPDQRAGGAYDDCHHHHRGLRGGLAHISCYNTTVPEPMAHAPSLAVSVTATSRGPAATSIKARDISTPVDDPKSRPHCGQPVAPIVDVRQVGVGTTGAVGG